VKRNYLADSFANWLVLASEDETYPQALPALERHLQHHIKRTSKNRYSVPSLVRRRDTITDQTVSNRVASTQMSR